MPNLASQAPKTDLAPYAEKLADLDISLTRIHDFAKCRYNPIGFYTYTHKVLGSKHGVKYYYAGGFYTKDLATAKQLAFNYTIEKILPRFEAKQWRQASNRNLLEKIKSRQLNIEPATLFSLDQRGFNKLEIINLAPLVGKTIDKLPTADVDFLNLMQDKYGLVFNFDDKLKGKANIKLTDVCGDFRNKAEKTFPQSVFTLNNAY